MKWGSQVRVLSTSSSTFKQVVAPYYLLLLFSSGCFPPEMHTAHVLLPPLLPFLFLSLQLIVLWHGSSNSNKETLGRNVLLSLSLQLQKKLVRRVDSAHYCSNSFSFFFNPTQPIKNERGKWNGNSECLGRFWLFYGWQSYRAIPNPVAV